jgi:hypothetical protein
MARSNPTITQQEGVVYHHWCEKHNVIPEDDSNAQLVARYFQEAWQQDVTEANLDSAFPQLKPHLKFKSAARLEAEKAARENSTISQKFADWFDAQNLIVKEGEDGFLNFAQLLRELRGRDVTTDTIFQAMGRISYRPGRPLVYVTKKRKDVDPNYKPGRFIDDFNKTPVDYEHERQAAYADKQESASTISKREQGAAKSEAESIRSGYSHAEDDQISRLFVTDERTRAIDWVATRNARQNLLRRFQLRREGIR